MGVKTSPGKAKRLYNLAQVSKLYLASWTQVAIAAELNITQGYVSQCLKALTKKWMEDALRNIDQIRATELARINRLELEYWEAWQKSTEDYKEQEIQSNEKSESKTIVKVAKTQKQNGDPRFLDGIRSCIEMRCKLLGLNHKEKMAVELMGEGGGPIKSQHAEVHIYLPDNGRGSGQTDS